MLNHAQTDGRIIGALLAASTPQDQLRGIVVAGTGKGTVSQSLQTALSVAAVQGVQIIMASRCAWGGVRGSEVRASDLSAVKARIELVLSLLTAT